MNKKTKFRRGKRAEYVKGVKWGFGFSRFINEKARKRLIKRYNTA